tara:strand:+ start:135 stop:497 length:363 start_codon:yes stop_codon:yes gene_type:complete
MFKEITKDNWLLFAQHNYENPTLEKEVEFYDDVKRFKYLKRLFRKYEITKNIKLRLVVNHVIVLQNVFGVEAAVTLMLYKIDRKYWPILKAVLNYLQYLYPHELMDVKEDKKIMERLKEI